MKHKANIQIGAGSGLAYFLLVASIVVELYTALSGILFVYSKGPTDDLPFIVNSIATYVCFSIYVFFDEGIVLVEMDPIFLLPFFPFSFFHWRRSTIPKSHHFLLDIINFYENIDIFSKL